MATLASVDKMQLEVDSDLSSSPISSAPVSPHQNGMSDHIVVARPPSTNSNQQQQKGVAESATSAQPHTTTNATLQTTNATSTTAQPVEKPKRVRKKKEVGPDGKAIDDGKPRVAKPRKPKVAAAAAAATNGATTTTAASRKRVKVEQKPTDSAVTSRQPTITEMVSSYAPTTATSTIQHKTEMAPVPPPLANTPAPRPSTSGQKYDPIRGMTIDSPYSRPAPPPPAQVPPHINRASASPSIASLIDPPSFTNRVPAAALHSPQNMISQPFVQSSPPQHSINLTPQPVQASPSPTMSRTLPVTGADSAMNVDNSPSSKTATKPSDVKAVSKASSAAPTPKPATARSSPPAHKGTGSGLLSSSDLFGGPTSAEGAERKGVNIDIQIKLDPNGGNHINVEQEIIKKYGRDAINPRAAAHRERLLQVRAAAQKVEGGSADDMSIDLMSDMGDDSNVEMGGMEDDPSAADGDKPRKRRKKTEEYDLDDEFIDDTELAWQQQAAVAKDGFFVYSGPLIPEGETARVEAANAAGRGGRARGGRARKSAATTTHASLAEKKEPTTTSPAPGRGRGGRARAPAAPRKPRPTKAEREKLEAEKASRASAIPANAPSTAPLPPPLAAPPAQTALSTSSVNVAT